MLTVHDRFERAARLLHRILDNFSTSPTTRFLLCSCGWFVTGVSLEPEAAYDDHLAREVQKLKACA
jgi:hypothetical protein